MHIIKSFEEILDQINTNTLVICDLDNTVFDYKSRCAIKIDQQINSCGLETTCINKLVPSLTDLKGFTLLTTYVKLSNSKLIFLTARPKKQTDSTNSILKYYKFNKYKVLYAGSEPKGKYLIENMDQLNTFNKIIYVDDLEENLNSVIYNLKKQDLQIPTQIYKFVLT